jgi:hypothetical protein
LPLLDYQCPQSWAALAATDDPGVRFCASCKRDVQLCNTPAEFIAAAEQGHCVAVSAEARPIHLCAHLVGQPSAESVAEFRERLRGLVEWWEPVIEQVPEAFGRQLEPMKSQVERRRAELASEHPRASD